MKTQQEIDKTAKKYFLQEEDDWKRPVYLFYAKAHIEVINYVEEQRIVDHKYTNMFWFFETNINIAISEFFRRLSNQTITDTNIKEIFLVYRTNENSNVGTGIKVEL